MYEYSDDEYQFKMYEFLVYRRRLSHTHHTTTTPTKKIMSFCVKIILPFFSLFNVSKKFDKRADLKYFYKNENIKNAQSHYSLHFQLYNF